jgi:hypothetical protein
MAVRIAGKHSSKACGRCTIAVEVLEACSPVEKFHFGGTRSHGAR